MNSIKNVLPANFMVTDQERMFNDMMQLYDLAAEMAVSMQKNGVINKGDQLEIGRSFIAQVADSANIISQSYTDVICNKIPITIDLQETFEKAFQNIFYAFKEFLDSAEIKLLKI